MHYVFAVKVVTSQQILDEESGGHGPEESPAPVPEPDSVTPVPLRVVSELEGCCEVEPRRPSLAFNAFDWGQA